MATMNKSLNNEHISDTLYELVREKFEDAQSIVISESGMSSELDFDHDTYFEQFTFSDMVTYLLTH